jgi:hypothetical protein
MPTPLSRRSFVRHSVLAAASLPFGKVLANAAQAGSSPSSETSTSLPEPASGPGAPIHWLEVPPHARNSGVTWGTPWGRGECPANAGYALQDEGGSQLAVQSWPLAYWPDGSIKWSAHAAVFQPNAGKQFRVVPGAGASLKSEAEVRVENTADEIVVDTGIIRCRLARSGAILVKAIERGGQVCARDGRLIGLRQEQPEALGDAAVPQHAFDGHIERATVEQSGPVRAVVKFEGKHREAGGRAWLPFTVRLYFYAGSEALRVMHTFVFDGDEQKDFIRGLGVRFSVPMQEELHDRHIRFAGEGTGLWAEATRPMTGLRRDPGAEARAAQIAGKRIGNRLAPAVANRIQYIPTWGDFTLSQLNADGFQIRKRTKAGHGWIPAGAGRRAGGVAFVGSPTGGLVFGQRDFWQRHPTQLDIRNATTDTAEITSWLWSPDAPPMDLRFYHDGLGMDTYEKQSAGLDITYEDYEPGFGSPVGVARTNELMFWAVAETPSRQDFVAYTEAVRAPAVLVAHAKHIHRSGVLAQLWSLPDTSSAAKAAVEKRNDFLIDFYKGQVEQRRWYGFWDFGDVMHTYDADRHTWRYDIGGFAWDNSELSPDLWLWFSFLRSGRADIFRLAEAMTRHTGEVDVHHVGRFAGLGSRHNVQHWGCSAKQVRVSNASYRRAYYYLTADERVGDLLHELAESHRAYLSLLPTRKLPGVRYTPPGPNGTSAYVSVGTDWGAIAAAWLTEWERTGNVLYRDRLLNSMKSIAALPKGFFSGGGLMNVETGVIVAQDIGRSRGDRLDVSHLNSVFGLVEVCAELIDVLPVPEFEAAWLDYCELYNAPAAEQVRRLGKALSGNSLTQGHSRLTAYAAKRRGNPALAERAWKEFGSGRGELSESADLKVRRVQGPDVLNPIDEAPWVSTNGAAQWGLAAIELLAWAGDSAPSA